MSAPAGRGGAEPPEDAPPASTWRRTPAGPVALVVGVLLLATGLVLGRPDAALLGLPLLVCAAGGRPSSPAAPARLTVRALPPGGSPGAAGDGSVPFELLPPAPPDAELVVLRVSLAGGAPRHLVVLPGRPLRGRVVPAHSGPLRVIAASAWPVAPDGAAVAEPVGPAVLDRVVAAAPTPLRVLPLPARPRGSSGGHDGVRPGTGGAFRDIGPFAPGDRLRAIDWKVTARRARFDGDLHVRRTTATADATVVIAVDSRDDVSASIRTWARGAPDDDGPSSLDLARRAASSLAAATVRAGDRVGLVDLGAEGRDVPAGAGGRHLQRVLTAVAGTGPRGVHRPAARLAPVPPDALVYLVSTFLDDLPADAAREWLARGHPVVAVDVLPAPAVDDATDELRLAHRVVAIERADRLAELRSAGAGTVRWEPDPAAQLLALSRRPVRGRRP